tara:strand:- start:7464 stop:7931 length:468 start_codon:yes stop_codon:yes gene_type:complete
MREKMFEYNATLPASRFSNIHAREEDQLSWVKEGWRITELLIAELSDDLHKRNIDFVAYSIPPRIEIENTEDMWDSYMSEPSYSSIKLERGYGTKRLQSLFAKLDRPFVSFLDVFDARRDEVLPYWQGHLNPNGHRIGAQTLFALLREHELVRVK